MKIPRILIALVAVIALASCSKKVLTSSEVKTSTKTIYTDTLVSVKVPVPIKTVELDTALLNGTVVKEENGIKITVTNTNGRTNVKAETLPDTVKADVPLKNKETTTTTVIEKVYEKQDTWLGKAIKAVGSHLTILIIAIAVLAVLIWRFKKTLFG